MRLDRFFVISTPFNNAIFNFFVKNVKHYFGVKTEFSMNFGPAPMNREQLNDILKKMHATIMIHRIYNFMLSKVSKKHFQAILFVEMKVAADEATRTIQHLENCLKHGIPLDNVSDISFGANTVNRLVNLTRAFTTSF
ncbi:unnamed protein product [Caenorhabditis bovis]|uniref:Uncharacterized protein n=1 Tax=Caenorhabditis bovis TaxID=2654633 RepID=A0A8S1EI22_9PELO|nr:unnamed protein product [Caenorhabditis bovis]